MIKEKLLIITPKQFGYHIDYYHYAIFLSERFNITFICWDYGLEKIMLPEIDIIYLSRNGNIFHRNLSFIYGVLKMIKKNNYNYIFSNYFKGCFVIPLFTDKSQNIHIDVRTGSVRKEKWKRILENKLINFEVSFYKSISVISIGLQKILKLPENSYILPLGAYKIEPIIKTTKYINLIYIGTFYNRNIDQTIEGLFYFIKNHPDIKIKYTIIGSGDKDSEIRINLAIKKYSLEKIVVQLGYVRHDRLEVYLKKSHIGISYVPINEYFQYQPATKTFEYLLAGLPVLATNTFENNKIITKENGELIDDNPKSFSLGLSKLINKIEELNPLAIQSTVRKYEWHKIIKDMNINLFK